MVDFSKINVDEIGNKKLDYSNINTLDLGNNNKSSSYIPDGGIDLGNNFDGSKKFSFESIYEDDELINNAKEFYETRDNIEFDTSDKNWKKDVVDEYINDRTWKQANITSAFKELAQVSGMKDEQLKRLSYLTEYWYNMPNFWEEGGRSASSAIGQNLYAGILDLTNISAKI